MYWNIYSCFSHHLLPHPQEVYNFSHSSPSRAESPLLARVFVPKGGIGNEEWGYDNQFPKGTLGTKWDGKNNYIKSIVQKFIRLKNNHNKPLPTNSLMKKQSSLNTIAHEFIRG